MEFKRLKKLNGAVAVRMQKALGDDFDYLAAEIENDRAELWECNGGDAYMITRVEADHLVICCYEGKSARQVVPHLIAAAQEKNLTALRFHSKRPALARLLKDYNPELIEYVYRINVEPEHG